jgi:hypothetical protein
MIALQMADDFVAREELLDVRTTRANVVRYNSLLKPQMVR